MNDEKTTAERIKELTRAAYRDAARFRADDENIDAIRESAKDSLAKALSAISMVCELLEDK